MASVPNRFGEREAVAYLIEENRMMRRQLGDVGRVSRMTIAAGEACGPTERP
jgi:hypothetical protein